MKLLYTCYNSIKVVHCVYLGDDLYAVLISAPFVFF